MLAALHEILCIYNNYDEDLYALETSMVFYV
jgi:hypothetical protein